MTKGGMLSEANIRGREWSKHIYKKAAMQRQVAGSLFTTTDQFES